MRAGILYGFVICLFVTACQRQQRESRGEVLAGPKGPPDNPTPQVRITSPSDGSVISGRIIPVRIETAAFTFAYEKATTPGTMTTLPEQYGSVPQEPNSGHVHVYLAPYSIAGAPTPTKFLMVKSFLMPNKAEFEVTDVKPGTYRLLVELVQHDHTPRIKRHPTDWPSFDMITVTVR